MTHSIIPRAAADFHVHVTAGRGKDPLMTVSNIVARAKELGRRDVGLLEHLAPRRGRPIEALETIREEIERLRDHEGTGVESAILSSRATPTPSEARGRGSRGISPRSLPRPDDTTDDHGEIPHTPTKSGVRNDVSGAPVESPLRTWFAAELEATEEGTFQGPPDVRETLGLDYAIGAVHLATKGLDPDDFAADHLRRMLTMLAGPVRFEVMAHPWRSVLTLIARKRGIPKPGFEVIPESMQRELIDACRAHGVAVEVNSGSPLDDPAHDAFLLRAVDAGVKLAVGSDAHHFDRLEAADRCAATLRRLGVDETSQWRP